MTDVQDHVAPRMAGLVLLAGLSAGLALWAGLLAGFGLLAVPMALVAGWLAFGLGVLRLVMADGTTAAQRAPGPHTSHQPRSPN